ncbi:CerR family C-terminal domain-containing protein [Pseudaeromonas sp. ZJS20]|uniref:CerR family C-terminal domain-containing protein n=1 Tax=Pseudaeromonas aegiceratis TaxID=3153928 RepID=UPI00390C77DF
MFQTSQFPNHSGGEETRQQLIRAATRVFLAEGFRAARVKEIAELAGVRLSAINYHFGGKEGLYLAVLRHHGDLALARASLASDEPNQSLEQRFAFAIHGLVLRMLDDSNECRLAQLMLRELANPTPALDVMFQQFSLPQAKVILALLQEVLGPTASHETQVRCLLSLFGQCMCYVMARPLANSLAPQLYEADHWLEEIDRHLVTFSWAGLQAIKASLNAPGESA